MERGIAPRCPSNSLGNIVSRFLVEAICAFGVLAASGLGLFEAWSYSGESGLMPRGVMIAGIVLSTKWLFDSIASFRGGCELPVGVAPIAIRSAAMLLIAGLALLLGMQFIGFFTSAAIVVPGLAMGLGYRRPMGLFISTVLFVALLVAVFRLLLGVPLPPEVFLTLMGN